MNHPYLEVISFVERLHRQLLEVVKWELEDSEFPTSTTSRQ